MQKIKFDFEATKQLIYAPNSAAQIGAPVDADGNVANDGTAIGIVLCRRNENNKYWVKQNLVVMIAGYCDIIDAQNIWGDEYSAEAIAAMSDITFCDNHELPTGGGGGWPADLPKPSVGGYGYTEQGEQVLYDGNLPIESPTGDGAFYSTTEIDTLEVGETYKVIWNGDEYVCDCVESDGDVYLGNGSILGFPITTDYPFVFIEIKGSVDVMTSPAGTYSIKVSKIGETVHKIAEKYLPVIPAAPSDDGTYTLTCTVTDGEPAYSWEPESVN